ncbi:MAG: GNAT family N-acetyltransferase [Nocardioides sp.]|nr:GNAT family N-acetyltransferase [Nocardioides sp.]
MTVTTTVSHLAPVLRDQPDPRAVVTVLPLSRRYAAWAADRHVADLPHGLFPLLGRRFVRRWHRAHLESPYGVGLVAVRDGEPVGFLLGSTDRRRHVAWLARHRRGVLARAGALALLLRPALAVHFLRTRSGRYARRLLARGRTETATTAAAPTPVAVLEAVVVAEEGRGHGVGRALVDQLLDVVHRAGTPTVDLVTKGGDDGAAGFYEALGWARVGEHRDRDGDLVATYRYGLGR